MWQFDNSIMEEWTDGGFYHGDMENTETESKIGQTTDYQLPTTSRQLVSADWRLATANFFLTPHASRLFFTLRYALVALRFAK
jgi:hypothetical protein